MKRTIIKDENYRGYIIKPVLSGFKIYRKDYYIGEYASKAVAKALIDEVVSKRKSLHSEETENPHRDNEDASDTQLSLFANN